MELITLAMPIYNVENCVERALLSAFDQIYDNIEFLLIDDKGTDNSMEVVKNIISTHPRGANAKIIEHSVNSGAGTSRNSAINCAKGNYLYFMDSDDEIPPDCIQKLYDQIQKENVDLVFGSCKVVNGTKTTLLKTKNIVERDKERIILSYFNGNYHLIGCNKLYTFLCN